MALRFDHVVGCSLRITVSDRPYPSAIIFSITCALTLDILRQQRCVFNLSIFSRSRVSCNRIHQHTSSSHHNSKFKWVLFYVLQHIITHHHTSSPQLPQPAARATLFRSLFACLRPAGPCAFCTRTTTTSTCPVNYVVLSLLFATYITQHHTSSHIVAQSFFLVLFQGLENTGKLQNTHVHKFKSDLGQTKTSRFVLFEAAQRTQTNSVSHPKV
jgi:hypothetical protein